MKKFTSLLTVLLTVNSVLCSVCKREFEETVCENFEFSPEIRLDSAANKLIIKHTKGTITPNNFLDLKLVNELIITENELTDIKTDALCTPPNLNSITVTKNKQFPKITRNVLSGCHNLTKLFLNGPEVAIENGAFAEMDNLQTLTLNDTILIDVLEAAFVEGLESLRSLTIKHANVKEIAGDTFNRLKNLKFLDLQANRIEEIAPGTFRRLLKLKVLNLADNKLKNLRWEEFQGLDNLRVLFLERNDFDTVDLESLIGAVPNLERIFLSYDRLSSENRKEIEGILPRFNLTVIFSGKPLE